MSKSVDYSRLDEQHAEFIEQKAGQTFDFVLESRQILSQEAHTTLNWLFAVIVGGSGYSLTLFNDDHLQWWLMPTLLTIVVVASWESFTLINAALLAGPVVPPGNEPNKLLTPGVIDQPIDRVRLGEAMTLQSRIERQRAHNRDVGAAINRARKRVALMPLFGGVPLLICLACKYIFG